MAEIWIWRRTTYYTPQSPRNDEPNPWAVAFAILIMGSIVVTVVQGCTDNVKEMVHSAKR